MTGRPGGPPEKEESSMKTAISASETTTVPGSTERASTSKRVNQRVKATAQPARKGSKSARIVALLQKPTGASLKALMKATGWQAHSVRAFLSAYVGKRLGLAVKSTEQDGQRVYAIQK
jgi:hypothetical protein